LLLLLLWWGIRERRYHPCTKAAAYEPAAHTVVLFFGILWTDIGEGCATEGGGTVRSNDTVRVEVAVEEVFIA